MLPVAPARAIAQHGAPGTYSLTRKVRWPKQTTARQSARRTRKWRFRFNCHSPLVILFVSSAFEADLERFAIGHGQRLFRTQDSSETRDHTIATIALK